MKKTINTILILFMTIILSACATSVSQPLDNGVISQGEPFSIGGERYMLSEVVRIPGYDTEDTEGYGVIIFMEINTAPVSFSIGGSNPATPKSLIEVTLDDENGSVYKYANVLFAENDASNYAGYAQFEFSLPKNAAFPKKGTFIYYGDKKEEQSLIFAGMKATRTISSPKSETVAQASPAAAPLAKGEKYASSYAELKVFTADSDVSGIHICMDTDIALDLNFERSDDLTIYIDEGATLKISASFIPVGCIIVNNGAIEITGTYNSGLVTFVNTGSVTVKEGGIFGPGQSDINNDADFVIENGGQLLIERGTVFNNAGSLTNNGYISINDGGAINDTGGSITNAGTIDLCSYFNGDITKITGSGKLNDNRKN